jgi:hypothetical protein
MGGVETVRGIGYQHAHAVLCALDVLADDALGAIRVEGTADVMDIEIHNTQGAVVLAKQVKIRSSGYSWGQKELLDIMRAWAGLKIASGADFEFLTDGRLGPTGEKVRRALDAASSEQYSELAELLGVAEASPICLTLKRARIRQDVTGVEMVLLAAEREVRAWLTDSRNDADADEQARQAVDRLFRLLSVRAGEADPAARVVPRDEIAETLGGLTHVEVSDRWPGTLRNIYTAAAAQSEEILISPRLADLDLGYSPGRLGFAGSEERQTSDGTFPLDDLLTKTGPSILAGPTGSGKSSATRLLRTEAAAAGFVVLVGHAETYVPGRLDALAADALGSVVRKQLPAITGRQVLNDPQVLVVVDGVSEVPLEVREALRDELRASVAAYRGARVLLVGRDAAALMSALPISTATRRYHLAAWNSLDRREAIRRTVLDEHMTDDFASAIAARVERPLGDAANNPMLFTMALQLINDGVPFNDRGSLYQASIWG